ncbi:MULTISPECIES: 8-oxoguanine DNA glycosylase OGG fold protein [unclassified Mycolicibacterium]|uniref:8-oxoguanine DNA glycosylase OGG fold protein n=1 Tax=unclassified Mycolicibacterium TaxID=2636767 RepID=UPI002ED8AD29
MAATPSTEIRLPEAAVTELRDVDVSEWIDDHAIDVERTWWNQLLSIYGFDNDPVGEINVRADVFDLAKGVSTDPASALRLLFNSLAWTSRETHRKTRLSVAKIADDSYDVCQILQGAAALSHTDPRRAYELLYPRGRAVVADLGPAVFTKYLYFAGGGDAEHPCCILDGNIALALQRSCGWLSLASHGWLAPAYERYTALLGRWVEEFGLSRRDVIERWLFEEGRRIRRRARGSR